jgi:hypothetical protein
MSLLTYVKENPIQSALTVASVIPAVRVASLLYKGSKVAYKSLSAIEAKQAVRKAIGVPKRSVTLYSGSVKGNPSFRNTSGAKYDKWFEASKGYGIRYTMPYLNKKLASQSKLPKIKDELKPYNKKYIAFANKGGGELRKVTLNQKEMLQVQKLQNTGKLQGFKSNLFSKNPTYHGQLPKNLLDKAEKIPLTTMIKPIKPTHYKMRGGWRKET